MENKLIASLTVIRNEIDKIIVELTPRIPIIENPMIEFEVPEEPKEKINIHQYELLVHALHGYPSIAKDIMRVYGIESLSQFPKDEFNKAMVRIEQIKRIEEDYRRKAS